MGIARPSTNRTDSRSVFMYLSQNLSKLFHSQRMHPLLFPLLFSSAPTIATRARRRCGEVVWWILSRQHTTLILGAATTPTPTESTAAGNAANP